MNVIGIRSTPGTIFYSIVSIRGANLSHVDDVIIIPKSFDFPQQLKYVRKTLFDIFQEYDIIHAGIRVTEPTAYGADPNRVMLEGVIQEMLASSSILSYFTGIKTSIGGRLGIPNDGSISDVMDGKTSFRAIPEWDKIRKEHRECIMVGVASKN